jgi:hypothetical protein
MTHHRSERILDITHSLAVNKALYCLQNIATQVGGLHHRYERRAALPVFRDISVVRSVHSHRLRVV